MFRSETTLQRFIARFTADLVDKHTLSSGCYVVVAHNEIALGKFKLA